MNLKLNRSSAALSLALSLPPTLSLLLPLSHFSSPRWSIFIFSVWWKHYKSAIQLCCQRYDLPNNIHWLLIKCKNICFFPISYFQCGFLFSTLITTNCLVIIKSDYRWPQFFKNFCSIINFPNNLLMQTWSSSVK